MTPCHAETVFFPLCKGESRGILPNLDLARYHCGTLIGETLNHTARKAGRFWKPIKKGGPARNHPLGL